MKTISSLAAATAALSLLSLSPAAAQQAGTYTGTTDDGNFVSFTVVDNGGTFEMTSADVNFTDTCRNPAGTANEGWGFFVGQNISGGKVSFVSQNDYYYISAKLTFVTDNKIKGTVSTRTAVFVPGTDPPMDAHFCSAPKQNLVATFQGPGHALALAPGAAVAYGHPASITARLPAEAQ
jgi:hypothetical protein